MRVSSRSSPVPRDCRRLSLVVDGPDVVDMTTLLADCTRLQELSLVADDVGLMGGSIAHLVQCLRISLHDKFDEAKGIKSSLEWTDKEAFARLVAERKAAKPKFTLQLPAGAALTVKESKY